jgi:hypothetical protein
MSDYLRFERGTLQTPVHHFVHPRTGRRITVIGTMHMGEPGYYAGLRTLIDGLEAGGAVVQCEGAALLPYDEQDLTDDERTALTTYELKTELEQRRVTELGWVRQLDALGYPDSWQVIDLDLAEITRRMGPDVMLRSELQGIKLFDRPDGDPRAIERFRLSLHSVFRAFRFKMWIYARRASGTRKPSRGADAVLLDQRDTVALDGVWSTEQDTVLIWGCAHLPALEADITDHGFIRTGATEWHTAATLPSIRAIQARLRALRHIAGPVTPSAVPATEPAESAPKP